MTFHQKIGMHFGAVILLAVLAGLVAYPKAVSKVPPLYNFLNKARFNLGLDLQGGIHLEYQADLSNIDAAKVGDAMQAIQDVIERRVNAFGVAEPVIYTTRTGLNRRLIVELAGVKDISKAKEMIKETPFLEFKEEGPADESKKIPQEVLDKMNAEAKDKAEDILKRALNPPAGGGEDFSQLAKDNSEDPGSKDNGGDLDFAKKGMFVPEFDKVIFDPSLKDGEIYPQLVETTFGWHIIKKIESRGESDPVKSPDGDNGASTLEVHAAHILISKQTQPEELEKNYISTGLTGKNLKNAQGDYSGGQGLSEPVVFLQFDDEGKKLFGEITKRNVGKTLAIYLDGKILSAPVVQTEIDSGEAIINGNFTIDSAKQLASRLREGALPVPISLVSQSSVEASLGEISLQKSLKAGIIGLILVVIFMLVYYRFLGLIASASLLIYTGLMISLFKISTLTPWSMTLTLPGIAGFILSIGMAVDANILIFERTKEEVRRGRGIMNALEEGFKRAWTSIRDGNVSSIITAVILMEMGTGFVKGFAITLIIGVLLSMFTAVTITRTFLRFVMGEWIEDKLWLIGVNKDKIKN
ncbi:MAG: protein translocase subunit SecD [Candidatus Moranbacteria bacterium]|nr:protein translocase subunit SecD [Candidatus Moranbacteria bacterium]